jgi:c(7)-type cytochrome triheme protein
VNRPPARTAGTTARLAWALPALLFAAVALGAAAPGDSTRTAPAIELRLPADIVYQRTVGADSAVTFSHQTHVMLAGNRCTGCHPAAFHMLSRGPEPTHAAMNAGSSCGLCHDGRQAFGVRDTTACVTCHSGPRPEPVAEAGSDAPAGGAEAPARLPKPHTYPTSADSPGPVTFRHKTHAGDAAGCVTCHPKPFRMAATPPLPDGGMHERQACGACHDGKKTFAADDPESCSRCHRESGARP